MTTRVFIGTYTEALPHVQGRADGISTALYSDGTLTAEATAAETRNPSWVVLDADRRLLYAVNETTGFDGAVGGGVTSFVVGDDGTLTQVESRPSYGAEPCHGELVDGGRYLVVANYRTGQVAVFAVDDGGRFSPAPTGLVVQHGASFGNPKRQEQPHAHAVVVDPLNGEVVVPDLGQDAIIRYRFDGGKLTEVGRIALLPGEGPRHLVFHPDKAHLFVVNELANTVATFLRVGEGPFVRVETTSTLPADFTGDNQTAALRMDSSGRHLYVTNRGHDSISVLEFDGRHLGLIQNVPAAGREPRELALDPAEEYVLVANQDSDEIAVRPRSVDGRLGEISGRYRFRTPVCLTFDRAPSARG